MKAILIRVGVDQAYGGWNAPVDPDTLDYVYVPIPENASCTFHKDCKRPYSEVMPSLRQFCSPRHLDCHSDLGFDPILLDRAMHLDPDFRHLTYGDDGSRRGAGITRLGAGDMLVFYAGLRPIRPCGHSLIYAVIGMYTVDSVRPISSIPASEWPENAHTRKVEMGMEDIVVRARRRASGRFRRCVPIGEWRDGAYRVRRDVLEAWGGLSVRDGYIQRSAVPPSFLNPPRFSAWLREQQVELVEDNF
jgi:hypothetical protein